MEGVEEEGEGTEKGYYREGASGKRVGKEMGKS